MIRDKTRFWSQLVYDRTPTPYPLGMTDDVALAALLKRILIQEAEAKLEAANGYDAVMTEVFKAKLQQLAKSLECPISSEIESVLLLELRDRLDNYIRSEQQEREKNKEEPSY